MAPDLDAARRLPPQLGQAATTRAMMIDVLVALLPALGMAVFFWCWPLSRWRRACFLNTDTAA